MPKAKQIDCAPTGKHSGSTVGLGLEAAGSAVSAGGCPSAVGLSRAELGSVTAHDGAAENGERD